MSEYLACFFLDVFGYFYRISRRLERTNLILEKAFSCAFVGSLSKLLLQKFVVGNGLFAFDRRKGELLYEGTIRAVLQFPARLANLLGPPLPISLYLYPLF